MGNFEKLSVLVIGVIIVMILVVALYTWTDDPAGDEARNDPQPDQQDTLLSALPPGGAPEGRGTADDGDGWRGWDPDEDAGSAGASDAVHTVSEDELDGTDAGSEDDGNASDSGFGSGSESDAPVAQEKEITVKRSETLSDIALRELGRASRWKLIADRNGISDPRKVREGMKLIIPVIDQPQVGDNKPIDVARGGSTGGLKPGASYTVRSGDTIMKLAQGAFGTIERWTDIWFANMDLIDDPRALRPGTVLSIPN